MWTVSITNVAKDPTSGIAQVTFQYDDSTKVQASQIVVERVSDTSTIKQLAINGVNALNNADAITALIAAPALGPVDITPPPPPPPDQQAYQQQRQALVVAKQDLDMGLLSQADYDVQLAAALAAKAKVAQAQITPAPVK